MRTATIQRETKETQIGGTLKIEGKGRYEVSTGIRFFDHMLELFTKHGGFDLKLHHAPLHFVQLLGPGSQLHVEPARSLIHQIDGFVRKEAIRDITMRQSRRCHKGAVTVRTL